MQTNNFEKYVDENKCVTIPVRLPGVDNSVNVYMKRIDLVHPVISGNKWYKMKYNIVEMNDLGFDTLLTFGGAYSNHIHAAAHAGKLFGFKTIGLIRGEEHLPLNSTLQAAVNDGMELHYINRTRFKERDTEEFIDEIKAKFGDVFILPLGGTNNTALKGCAEIVEDFNLEYDYICSAAGSGGTSAGIIAGLAGNKKMIVFPALKGAEFMYELIEYLIMEYSGKKYSNWNLNTEYHFGGFAKLTKELVEFTKEFEQLNGFELDYIYTNKMVYGISNLINKGFFKSGETIVAVHSGGLQGNEAMKEKARKIV
ncbi:MAG: pyridoxal-phosphate dependent enzyme [Bacteroidota bacterium]